MSAAAQPLSPNLIAKIDRVVARYGTRVPVPVAEVVVRLAPLGIAPSAAFAEFISRWGGCYVGVAVHGWENAPILGRETCVDLTRGARASLGDALAGVLVFADDDGGNPIGILPNGRVCLFDHDNGETTELADDFAAFLGQITARDA